MGDFNLALVIVAIVVTILVFIFNLYLLINYQHHDDKNQAHFPKFVVVLGLSVSAISILMLPADVANRQACQHAVYNGACNLTLPMKSLWLVVYIVDVVLVFFVIPFAMFYYEGDQDKSIEDMKQHFEQSVLSKLPERYNSHSKQSVISEEDDMVAEPKLDSFVICRTRKFLGAHPVDDSGEENPLDMYAGDIYALRYKSIKPLIESGQLDLV